MVQIIGPQVVAKPRMKRQAKTIRTMHGVGVAEGSVKLSMKWPTDAKIMKQMNIQMEPAMRDLRRPKCSTMYRPIKVTPKLMLLRMNWVTKELICSDLKMVVP